MKHFGEDIIKYVLRMKTEEKANREISQHYEFKDKFVIKRLISRFNRKQRMMQVGINPR